MGSTEWVKDTSKEKEGLYACALLCWCPGLRNTEFNTDALITFIQGPFWLERESAASLCVSLSLSLHLSDASQHSDVLRYYAPRKVSNNGWRRVLQSEIPDRKKNRTL